MAMCSAALAAAISIRFRLWWLAPLARLFPTLAWGICMHWRKQKQYRRGFLEYPVQQRLETNFFLGEEPG